MIQNILTIIDQMKEEFQLDRDELFEYQRPLEALHL